MAEIAAALGSDCPLFLADGPVVMRGRGEQVERLPVEAATRLRGRRVLIFKPGFGISTPWAYRRMVATPGSYLAPEAAEARLAAWVNSPGLAAERLMLNTMEPVVFAKFLALPALLEQLREQFGLTAQMSGSGSACFAFLPEDAPVDAIKRAISAAWGESTFVTVTRIE
jgi:4-diphosphocytidyl-2-C-methyl-D-erythritol kinase